MEKGQEAGSRKQEGRGRRQKTEMVGYSQSFYGIQAQMSLNIAGSVTGGRQVPSTQA